MLNYNFNFYRKLNKNKCLFIFKFFNVLLRTTIDALNSSINTQLTFTYTHNVTYHSLEAKYK